MIDRNTLQTTIATYNRAALKRSEIENERNDAGPYDIAEMLEEQIHALAETLGIDLIAVLIPIFYYDTRDSVFTEYVTVYSIPD